MLRGRNQAERLPCLIQGHHARAVYSVDWGEAGLVTGGGDDAIR